MRMTLVMVALAGLLGCGQADPVAASAEKVRGVPDGAPPELVVSTNRAEAVIRVAIENHFALGSPTYTYTLFGDGRLELTETPQGRKPPGGTQPSAGAARSVSLDAAEIHAVVALAAAPVLIEGEPGAVAAELQAAGATIADGSVVTVDLRFMRYTHGAIEFAPVERRFVMVAPTSAAEAFPDRTAVQALARIVRQIEEIHRAKAREQ